MDEELQLHSIAIAVLYCNVMFGLKTNPVSWYERQEVTVQLTWGKMSMNPTVDGIRLGVVAVVSHEQVNYMVMKQLHDLLKDKEEVTLRMNVPQINPTKEWKFK